MTALSVAPSIVLIKFLSALEFMWCLCLQISVNTGLIPWTGCGLIYFIIQFALTSFPEKWIVFQIVGPYQVNVGMPHLALGFSTLRTELTYSSRWYGPQIHMWERYLSEDGNTKQ